MELKATFRSFVAWGVPFAFVLSALGAVFIFAEKEMNVPGSFRDIQYWENVLENAHTAGDVSPLSGYLHHRVAEMLIAPTRQNDALAFFSYLDNSLHYGDPARKIPDLKYALSIYKKQRFLSVSPVMRLYFSLGHPQTAQSKSILGENLFSDSDADLEGLSKLQGAINAGDLKAAEQVYAAAVNKGVFSNVKSSVILQMAYAAFDTDPEASREWLKRMKDEKTPPAIGGAADYLKQKVSGRINFKINNESSAADRVVEKCLSQGAFAQAAQYLSGKKHEFFSTRVQDIAGWLGLTTVSDKNNRTFFADYFQIIRPSEKKAAADTVDMLAKLAQEPYAAAYSAFLRYQAWGMAYFDFKDYSKASSILDFLKIHDPLSSYSQLESMQGLYKVSTRSYSHLELQQIWEHEKYRFEMHRQNDWAQFKDGKNRVSETRVTEGKVYVINYDEENEAQKLQEVAAGQRTGTPKDAQEQESAPMNSMERIVYDQMSKIVPAAVKAFKQQILQLSPKNEDKVFVRLYSQEEFNTFILTAIQQALGVAIAGLQVQISEQGLSGYGVLNLKLINPVVEILGKMLADEDGRLILKLDHAKVGWFSMPSAVLRAVEKGFYASALSDSGDMNSRIDILKMDYQPGGILIKCRKKKLPQG